MAKVITNPQKPVVRVNVAQNAFSAIAFLAQTVHDLMLANVAIFATPLPTSANFQTDITALFDAIAALGTKSNKGGKAALDAVKAAAFVVFADLTSRAAYVQEIVDGSDSPTSQAVIISASGFAAKNKRSRVPKFQFAKFVRQTNNKQFPVSVRRVNWRKMLGNIRGLRAKAYNIYYNTNDPLAVHTKTILWTSTTACNHFVRLTAAFPEGDFKVTSITIKPVNARGEGNGFTIDVK